ncbi:MAG: LysR family transcriptional regulator [Pseudomonadota bacterium]
MLRMKLAELTTFIEVVEAGGMTQAAARRGVSQPGISRVVRDIERSLQAQLLRRTGRGVELTPAGERFLAFARETLEHYAETRRAVLQLADAVPSSLTIVVPLGTGHVLLPPLLKRFAAALPEVNLHLHEDASTKMMAGVVAGDYDIALICSPPALASQIDERLYCEQLYLVGPAAAVGEDEQAITMAEVAQLPLLVPGTTSAFRRLIDACFAEAMLVPRIVRTLETSETLLAFALEGEGVAILPYSNVLRQHGAGEVAVRPIVEQALEREICLAIGQHLHAKTVPTARRAIKEAVRSVAATLRWAPASRAMVGDRGPVVARRNA